jgi:hypothetical protein
MAEWVHVTNNTIDSYYDMLPKNWKNISGLDKSINDLTFLKSQGWLPVTKNVPSYNSDTHYISRYDYTVRSDDVLETAVIENKSLPSPSLNTSRILNDGTIIPTVDMLRELFGDRPVDKLRALYNQKVLDDQIATYHRQELEKLAAEEEEKQLREREIERMIEEHRQEQQQIMDQALAEAAEQQRQRLAAEAAEAASS